MNIRRASWSLSGKQVDALVAAGRSAEAAGAALNFMISVRLARIEALAPEARSEPWANVRKQVQIRLRRLGVDTPTFVWTREAEPGGAGEHLHVLAHVPGRLHERASRALEGWMPDGFAMRASPYPSGTWRLANGRVGSGILYIAKQMDAAAARARNYNSVSGSPIIGRRCGMTASLRAAIRITRAIEDGW